MDRCDTEDGLMSARSAKSTTRIVEKSNKDGKQK